MHDPKENTFKTTRTKVKKYRTSALYNTLARLIATNSNLLQNVVIEKGKEGKGVFYLKFKHLPKHGGVISETAICEHHLTIHKSYKQIDDPQFKNGLSIAHYTLDFRIPGSPTRQVAHVYFNREVVITHTQIKRYTQSDISLIDIDYETEKTLRLNAVGAINFLNELIITCNDLYQSAYSEVLKLDKDLEIISSQLLPKSYAEYIKTAEHLMSAIEKANLYCLFTTDSRGKLLKQNIENLREQVARTVKKEPVTVLDETNGKLLESKEKLYEEIVSPQVKFCRAPRKKTKNTKLEERLSQEKLEADLRLKLLVTSALLSEYSEDQIKKLKLASAALSQCTNTVTLFAEKFWTAKQEIIEELYQYVAHKLDPAIIALDILLSLIYTIPSSKEEEIKLKQKFIFLFENCHNFRFIINYQVATFYYFEDKKVALSPLVLSCIKNNLFAFELLLEYGQSPNEIGIAVGDLLVPAIHQILLICGGDEAKWPFIQLAIKHGARYDCLSTIGNTRKVNPLKFLPIRHRLAIESPKNIRLAEIGFGIRNAIDVCLALSFYQAAELFIPQMTLEDQIELLGKISNQKNVFKGLVPAPSEHQICLVQNAEHSLSLKRELLTMGRNAFSIIVYSSDTRLTALMAVIISEARNQISKLKEVMPKDLEKIYDQLFEKANFFFKMKNVSEAFNRFEVCLWFLFLDTAHTPKSYQMLIKLYCLLIKNCKNDLKRYQHLIAPYYTNALLIAEHGRFVEIIEQTPIYKFLKTNHENDKNILNQSGALAYSSS